MRITNETHLERPWRIHSLVPDFRLEDAWSLDTPGTRDDFERFLALGLRMDPAKSAPAVRLLFALRWKIGELLGWDDHTPPAHSLRQRLPDDLRADDAPEFGTLPFTPLYVTDDEFAAEIANSTMHGVLHIGWVEGVAGVHHAEMAVWVKRNGLLGTAYMAAIHPFRHLIVYPPMIRAVERAWAREPVHA
jgi:hypothetical protein